MQGKTTRAEIRGALPGNKNVWIQLGMPDTAFFSTSSHSLGLGFGQMMFEYMYVFREPAFDLQRWWQRTRIKVCKSSRSCKSSEKLLVSNCILLLFSSQGK